MWKRHICENSDFKVTSKNALSQADSKILDIQFILHKLISRLSAYKNHLCKKALPIPIPPFLYDFKGFPELRNERQNRKPVAIAQAPLVDIFIYMINL